MNHLIHLKNPNCFIHSNGKIYTYGHHHHNKIMTFRLLKYQIDKDGYFRVNIRGKCYFLHRLIAEAFIENPNNNPVVDHINHNRQDNRIENLRWVTIKENAYNLSPSKIYKHIGVRRVDNKKEYTKRYNALRRCAQLMMRKPDNTKTSSRVLSKEEYDIMKPLTQKERFIYYQNIKTKSALKNPK